MWASRRGTERQPAVRPARTTVHPDRLGDAHGRRTPAPTEPSTSAELRKLDERRWAVIDDVTCEGSHVDHVLVGPDAVYAVANERLGEVTRADRERLVQRATRSAYRLQRSLHAQGTSVTVTPMVVVWGPGTSGVREPIERLGAVNLVAGTSGKRWRKRLDRSADGDQLSQQVVEAVRSVGYRPELPHARSA